MSMITGRPQQLVWHLTHTHTPDTFFFITNSSMYKFGIFSKFKHDNFINFYEANLTLTLLRVLKFVVKKSVMSIIKHFQSNKTHGFNELHYLNLTIGTKKILTTERQEQVFSCKLFVVWYDSMMIFWLHYPLYLVCFGCKPISR